MQSKIGSIITIFLVFNVVILIAQNQGFVYNGVFTLEKVNFCKPTVQAQADKWIVIKEDTDPNQNISGLEKTTAWENGQKKDPIAYVSDVEPYIEAYFNINCKDQTYYVKATNSEGYNFPVRLLVKSNGKYMYPITKSNKFFTNEVVRYWEDFELIWFISINEDGPWIQLDVSKNYLYVTHKSPIIGTFATNHISPTNAQHTLIYLGCKNSNGLTNPNNIIDGIYNEFLDRDVRLFNGSGPIKYWGSSSTLCWDVPTMLINLDGACQGWASIFEDIIRLQGISDCEMATVTYNDYILSQQDIIKLNSEAQTFFGPQISNLYTIPVNIPGYTGIRADFFVKNWSFNDNINFVLNEYHNFSNGIITQPITLNNGNIISFAELSGAEAQGNEDPRSEFENHAISKYNGKYYDPSYGSQIADGANYWETNALDGFGSILVYNHLGVDYFINWIGHLNDNTYQASIKP